jgi:hypothetical protein
LQAATEPAIGCGAPDVLLCVGYNTRCQSWDLAL